MRFGPYELDAAIGELRKSGVRLKVRGQPVQVLGMLLERPGTTVSRKEICERLWADETFVDFDHSLNSAIKRLRRALDDDPEHPQYVETVPNYGYRFIGILEPEECVPALVTAHVSAVEDSGEVSGFRKPSTWKWVVAAALLLGIVVAAMAMRWRQTTAPASNSIAVLPFSNASGDSRLDYLSDGIADNIVDELSQFHGFHVTAWSVASQIHSTDAAAIGRQLRVGAVLTGTLEKKGDALVVRSELLDPVTGQHLWGGEYERPPGSASSIQSQISSDIANRYKLKLTQTEKQSLAAKQSTNPEAYDLYLKGRYYSTKGTKESLKMGLAYFVEATEKDPKYALAYSGLAYYYFVAMDWILPPKEASMKARAAAEKAISLDGSLAEAHTMLGMVRWTDDLDWSGSEQEFRQAIVLNDSYAPAYQFYALFLASLGRNDEAIAASRRALSFDPLSVELNANYGQVLARTGHTDESIAQQQKTVALDPNDWFSHMGLGFSYLQAIQSQKAIVEFENALRLEENADVLGGLGLAYGLSGNRTKAEGVLRRLEQRSSVSYVPPYDFAQVYAGLGNKDEAFRWLDKAREDRGFGVVWLKVGTDMDTLRSDPRYDALLRSIGFPGK
jgi:TolB-like protein/DNA-binding winged helix-turn-helix (wHTH) protein